MSQSLPERRPDSSRNRGRRGEHAAERAENARRSLAVFKFERHGSVSPPERSVRTACVWVSRRRVPARESFRHRPAPVKRPVPGGRLTTALESVEFQTLTRE